MRASRVCDSTTQLPARQNKYKESRARMFSYIDHLEVVKFHYDAIPRTDRISQGLTLKIPRTKTVFYVSVANRIRLPQLKKGDKVRLVLDFYVTGRSMLLRWTVRDVILLHDTPDFITDDEEKRNV